MSAKHTIQVERVQTQKGLTRFLRFPWTIQGRDPAWTPPLEALLRQRLRSYRPLLAVSDMHLFLALRGDEVVGTISVQRDRQHERLRSEPVAFFGFFETIDDRAVSHALLEHATTLAKSWGARTLRGPRDLSRAEQRGLTVEGFDQRSPILAGHHPAWYAQHVQDEGFVHQHDALAYAADLVDAAGAPRPVPEHLAQQADAVTLPGLEVRAVQWRHTARDLDISHQVFVRAFFDVPDNTPMSRQQFLAISWAFLAFTDRHMLQIATTDGQAAGFALCVPELNEAIHYARGRLLPTGWARLGLGLRQIRTASFKLLGVVPEHRGSGLHARLIAAAIHGCQAAGYQRIEGSLVDERNGPMRHICESAGMTIYKRFRVYERAIS